MQLEENLTKNKKNVTNLKKQCDNLASQLKSIEDLTRVRWDNIDKVINIFKYSIAIIILINLTILFFIIGY
jgi:hypothetical protein